MSTITEVYRAKEVSFIRALEVDRRDGHRYLMSCLNDVNLDRESPRRAAGLLWDIDSMSGIITIRRNAEVPFQPTLGKLSFIGAVDSYPKSLEENETFSLFGKVARQYSPLVRQDPEVEEFLKLQNVAKVKRPRSRLQPVLPENLNHWAGAKLERLGLEVHEVNADVIPDIRLSKNRKKESVPAAKFHALVSGKPEDINKLLAIGFGRAKNFGLGLVHFQQYAQNQN